MVKENFLKILNLPVVKDAETQGYATGFLKKDIYIILRPRDCTMDDKIFIFIFLFSSFSLTKTTKGWNKFGGKDTINVAIVSYINSR